MSDFTSEEDYSFTATHAEIEYVSGSETDIERLIFHTDDVPKGQITSRPKKDKDVEKKGIPGTSPDSEHYTLEELPDEVVNAMQKAVEMDEVKLQATVTKADDGDDDPNFFINSNHLETLSVVLIQDEGGE